MPQRIVFDQCETVNLEVEVLVNNAGMLVTGDVVEVDYSRAADILQLHVNTPALALSFVWEKNDRTENGIYSQRIFHFGCDALPGHFLLRAFKNLYPVFHPCTENRNEAPWNQRYLSAPRSYGYRICMNGHHVNIPLGHEAGCDEKT